jgi:hypothetical protein
MTSNVVSGNQVSLGRPTTYTTDDGVKMIHVTGDHYIAEIAIISVAVVFVLIFFFVLFPKSYRSR